MKELYAEGSLVFNSEGEAVAQIEGDGKYSLFPGKNCYGKQVAELIAKLPAEDAVTNGEDAEGSFGDWIPENASFSELPGDVPEMPDGDFLLDAALGTLTPGLAEYAQANNMTVAGAIEYLTKQRRIK